MRGPIAEKEYINCQKAISKKWRDCFATSRCLLKEQKGWDYAQVTKGGVCLDEIDLTAMESKITKDLYFAGEVVDYDGPCGGYNLQYAFETGMLAGKEMANE